MVQLLGQLNGVTSRSTVLQSLPHQAPGHRDGRGSAYASRPSQERESASTVHQGDPEQGRHEGELAVSSQREGINQESLPA